MEFTKYDEDVVVVQEIVMFGGEDHRSHWGFGEAQLSPYTHKITFTVVDGKPDLSSIKMQKP